MTDSKTPEICRLNDQFRKTAIGGMIMTTPGVQAQEPQVIKQIMSAVQTYDQFSTDNDPYAEHDFGSFEVEDLKLFWKIDYYALDLLAGSEDPANPEITKRVLTIMLREEY